MDNNIEFTEEELLRRKEERKRARRKRKIKIMIGYLILLVVFVAAGLSIVGILSKNGDDVAVPEVIKEFVEKYPEAEEYADNYGKYYNKDLKMNVSSEMKERDIPLLYSGTKDGDIKSMATDTSARRVAARPASQWLPAA